MVPRHSLRLMCFEMRDMIFFDKGESNGARRRFGCGGRNCSTRSVLRHTPKEGYAGPSQTLKHPWGLPTLSRQEFEKVGDDVLLFWMVLLYVVTQLASLSAAPFGACNGESCEKGVD